MGTFNTPPEEVIYFPLLDENIETLALDNFKSLAFDIEELSNDFFEIDAKVEYGYCEGAYIVPKIAKIIYSYEIIDIQYCIKDYFDDYIECDYNIFNDEDIKEIAYDILLEFKLIKKNLNEFEFVNFNNCIDDYYKNLKEIKKKIDELCIKQGFTKRAIGGWTSTIFDITKKGGLK